MFNIEIKARIDNLDEMESKAREISDNGEKYMITQTDTFFNILNSANNARLKLRQFEDGSGELIYYERPDEIGPKISKYTKKHLDSESFQQIYNILSLSNGIIGKVNKIRHLYVIDQTRIHIDKVSGLGDFVELEVAVSSEDQMEYGKQICEKIINILGIKKNHFIADAYIDLIMNNA